MYALMENELFIRARKADVEIVEKAAKDATAEFGKEAGVPIETEVDSDSPLSAERFVTCNCSKITSAGGVIILGHGGRIELDNTLEERLKLLESSSLPKIRITIFGYVILCGFLTFRQSATRKFFD
jgi:V-type H+-transporting ATPase subunit E